MLTLSLRPQWAISISAAALFVVISAGVANAQLMTWTYDTSKLQYVIDDGGFPAWQSYSLTPTVGATTGFESIHIFGTGPDDTVFDLTGADYIPSPFNDPDYRGALLTISGAGTFDGANWVHPVHSLPTDFEFGVGFSGGTLEIFKVETGFTLYNSNGDGLIGVGSGTGIGPLDPGGYGFEFSFEDRFGSNYQTAVTFDWQVRFAFDWTGMAPEDTLNFNISNGSVDMYVRTCKPCDANCDGSINLFDIEPFVQTLSGSGSPCSMCAADANEDGSINLFDIDPFVQCLGG